MTGFSQEALCLFQVWGVHHGAIQNQNPNARLGGECLDDALRPGDFLGGGAKGLIDHFNLVRMDGHHTSRPNT